MKGFHLHPVNVLIEPPKINPVSESLTCSLSTHLALQKLLCIQISLLRPLLPELRVVDVYVVPVRRQTEAGLGEGRPLDPGLDLDDLRTSLEDVFYILLAEVVTRAVILH